MGPLSGLKIIEMDGIEPCPFGAMLMADLSATVLMIDRKSDAGLGVVRKELRHDLTRRNRPMIAVDLKSDLGGGAPWYACYETADGKYISVGAVERKFYAGLLDGMGLSPDYLHRQMDRATWPEQKRVFGKVFQSRSRADWESVFEGRSACFAPVLTLEEAANHPQMKEREIMTDIAGIRQSAHAPGSATPYRRCRYRPWIRAKALLRHSSPGASIPKISRVNSLERSHQ